jgi:outer membrane protein assembly factor BamB
VTQLPKYDGGDKDKPIVWSGPVLAGGRLIVTGSGGMMLEVDPRTGNILKERKLGADATIAPLVANNTLLVLTENGELTAWR